MPTLVNGGVRVNLYKDRPPKPAPARLPPMVRPHQADEVSPWDASTALRRYPRLVAHVICQSLGYFTPTGAAIAIADALNAHENWCEYVFSCHGRDPVRVVRRAIHGRHSHRGYMAHYPQALAVVACQILSGEEPFLASWF
jgi:hypothetical protein